MGTLLSYMWPFVDIGLQIISRSPRASEVIWRFNVLNEFQAYKVNNAKIIRLAWLWERKIAVQLLEKALRVCLTYPLSF